MMHGLHNSLKNARWCAFVLWIFLCTLSLPAAPIYSGTVNFPITQSNQGTYINFITGQVQNGGSSGPTGWDLNVWMTGASAWRVSSNSNGSAIAIIGSNDPIEFAPGDTIGSASSFSASNGLQPSLGVNYYGIQIFNEATSSIHYGWVRLSLSQSPLVGTIIDYAYESQAGVSIQAGATGPSVPPGVPEPGSIVLVASAGVALFLRQRFRKKS
jgi:hypothetical protein